MPVTLRSGLTLLLTGDARFDPGKNWFKSPSGHFGLKVAAPEMGPPLFDPEKQVWEAYEHAAVPRNRSEATASLWNAWRWYGDLARRMALRFPEISEFIHGRLGPLEKLVERPGLERFLDEIIELCAQYARNSQDAPGYFLTPGPKIQKK
jgi:hypothetical protein